MKQIRHYILSLFCTLAIPAMVMAIPARKGTITRVQSNGESIEVQLHGDELFHYTTTTTGEWIEPDNTGTYHIATPLSEREIQVKRTANMQAMSPRTQARPLNIAPRGLIILVSFQDVKFTTSKDTMDTMLMGNNFVRKYDFDYSGKHYSVESNGSARQYFEASSWGQYSPKFDIIGPVTVSQNMADYGRNVGGRDVNPQGMIAEACKEANNTFGVDFSQYDNDNDGYVDFVYVIYAGYGESDGGGENTIWPHTGNLSSRPKYDGKTIYKYACGSELNFWSKTYYGIGVFCHEFGHVLGLPDLYTNSGDHKTSGYWDIMDQGSYANDANTPPTYTAYERFFMGWMKPTILTTPANEVCLSDLDDNNNAYLISPTGAHNLIGNDPTPTTFYLLENHQKKGWTKSNPGEGMLITKIQYNYSKWANNTVNAIESAMGIDIIEADGYAPYWSEKTAEEWKGKPGDCFPTGATEYKAIDGYPITNIRQDNGNIYFKFMGGTTSLNEHTREITHTTKKLCVDGQVVIQRNDHYYNILGLPIQ